MLISKLRRRGLLGRRKKIDEGFTLIELLVVVTILGILAAVVVMSLSGIGDKGKSAAAGTDSSILRTAEEAACANQNLGYYEDSPQLLRDGMLATIGEYNDVDMNPINGGGTCTGTAPNTGAINPNTNLSLNPANINTHYAMFTPTTTSYPISVTSCDLNPAGGVAGPLEGGTAGLNQPVGDLIHTSINQAPQKVLAVDQIAYETLLDMGLGTVAYYDSSPTAAATMIAGLPPSLQSAATADLIPNGTSGAPGSYLLTPNSLTAAPYDWTTPTYLAQNGIDLVYTTVPGNLEDASGNSVLTDAGIIKGTSPTDTNASGVPAYLGFNEQVSQGFGLCYNTPKDNSGNLLPVNTLETTYHELRTLGTIFNVQNTAAQAIYNIKSQIATDLVNAKAHNGNNPETVAALDQCSLVGFSDEGRSLTPDECVDPYDGTTGVNAVIVSAGGSNVLGKLVPATDNTITALSSVAAFKPQILVLMTLDGTSGTSTTCQSMASAASPFGTVVLIDPKNIVVPANSVPAVCVNGQDFDGTRPRSQAGIQALANVIQAMPAST